MIFGLLYFCVVILCVNRSRSSFILYRIVKRHSRQSNVRRIWTCADNDIISVLGFIRHVHLYFGYQNLGKFDSFHALLTTDHEREAYDTVLSMS